MHTNMKLNLDFDADDLGTLCICAIRYCMGRKTYMPSLVHGIVMPLLPFLSDRDISVMIDDCDFQKKFSLYGDDIIDKPGWLYWETTLKNEQQRRINNG